ncbi:MAG: alpha/beta fold hydrolase [Gammaproteobacteria bacterium]
MDHYFDLNPQVYDWCARAFDQVRKVLGVRIKMHYEHGQIDEGDIFLFNHFARFETFIPQYLIYQEDGAYCRSVAAAAFFKGNDRFAAALRDLGVVPNDHPRLMELLASDVLRGRKIIVFPEGGMVKNRQVLDEQGGYSVYSRHAEVRRKHHTGPARLAIGLSIFLHAVRQRRARGDAATLERWAEHLELAEVEVLLDAAERPVTIVPANITFYPLRISDNILRRGADLVSGGLSPRAIEELVIEGNILLKATDMDINLGRSMAVDQQLSWLQRPMLGYLARSLPDLGSIFDIDYLDQHLIRRTATRAANTAIARIRDGYMHEIYISATVNLSHLASSIILRLVELGTVEIDAERFRRTLYLAVKYVQAFPHVRLHRGLCDPTRYQPVLDAEPSALSEFLDSAAAAELLEHDEQKLAFRAKLAKEHEFDSIRLENPVEVYANEVEPLGDVTGTVDRAITNATALTPQELAWELFDDELKALAWDRRMYDKPRHQEINERETATADPSPFLYLPPEPRRLGVVLVHGFLASPAEVREFGDKLRAAGYRVVGVRLKGHGTSPWDLRDRSWRDWHEALERGRRIIAQYGEHHALVGFSTGGSLGLVSAAERPAGAAGVVAVCPPIKFRNRNMRFVPLMHGANRVVRWLSSYEGVMPFRPNESEHPHINYRNMPLRGLYELTRLAGHLNRLLGQVELPTCIVQADEDRVVDPKSATIAYEKVRAETKELHWIPSQRHGILNEDIGETHQVVLDFLAHLDDGLPSAAPAADA